MINAIWQGLGRSARIGLITGLSVIAMVTIIGIVWLLRTDYQVLFADLSVQDSAALVAELEKQKIPYKLGENGTSILVDKDAVHRTRLKLMGKDMPLHGAVGFELFNNTDFGMTEFAQKINYQRALQGELTRTILSLPEVRDVRVHLALPEQGLFKQSASVPTAAIHLSLKQGRFLRPEQTMGIQRLVAASVPGILAQNVTIVDQHGVALTRLPASDEGGKLSSSRLDLKKETENYLSRKAGEVLEKAFGPGQAIVSVDVVLDMDMVRTTTEDVMAPPGKNGMGNVGVVVREREVLRDAGAPLDARLNSGDSARGNNSQREIEYQVGRRIEQVVSQPGSIRRIQVAAIVRSALDAGQAEQLKAIVAAAVGASSERGDAVVIQTFDALPAAKNGLHGESGNMPSTLGAHDVSGKPPNQAANSEAAALSLNVPMMISLILLTAVAIITLWSMRRSKPVMHPILTEEQRRHALVQVQNWLSNEPSRPGRGI